MRRPGSSCGYLIGVLLRRLEGCDFLGRCLGLVALFPLGRRHAVDQAAGRILRPAPGKHDAILIDHTGAVRELGFVDDDFQWSLDGAGWAESKTTDGGAADVTTVTCPGCKRLIRPAPQCPECGREMKSESKRAIKAKEAELEEIQRREKDRERREWSMEEKRRFFGELRGIARAKGYKDGWAVHAYQERIGSLPWPVYKAPAMEPSEDTTNWAKHLQIRKAKAREGQSGAERAAGESA